MDTQPSIDTGEAEVVAYAVGWATPRALRQPPHSAPPAARNGPLPWWWPASARAGLGVAWGSTGGGDDYFKIVAATSA